MQSDSGKWCVLNFKKITSFSWKDITQMITSITEMATSIATGGEPQSQPVLEEQTAQTSNKYVVALFLFILSDDIL